MKNENLKLCGEEMYGLRKRAVQMKSKGHTHKEVAHAFGIGESTSEKWWSLYRHGGLAALFPTKRGRKTGEKRHLSTDQEEEIRRLITDEISDQLKMPFALWTRPAVTELIRLRYGIKMPVRTMGEYLKRWGYTPQKP